MMSRHQRGKDEAMAQRLSRIRDQAREVGRAWSGSDAPANWRLTAALFELLADDDDLLVLAGAIPAERLPPLLFVASVQHLVARHPDQPFSAYFPVAGGDQPSLDDRFADRYRRFCLDHQHELTEVWDRHVYQMNEVARTTQVALALGVVHSMWPERPVALVDVGTGAGFGLYPDLYGYMFSDRRRFGDSASPVQLTCDIRGALHPRLAPLPVIETRTGIDVNPIDLDDSESRAWLRACLPPETTALRRMIGAIDVARKERASIVQGTAERALPDVLAGLADGPLVCVMDTYTAVFFGDDGRRRLGDLIAAYGRERDVVWISLDPLVPLGTHARRTVQGVDAPERLVTENRRGGVFAVLSIVTHVGSETTTRLLALAHPSGTRMEWLDESTAL
jgi:hypothetical protein